MVKLVIVNVPAQYGIPAHTAQMLPEEAARLWELWETQSRDQQMRRAAAVTEARNIPAGSGVRFAGPSLAFETALRSMGLDIAGEGAETVPFERTLIWDPDAPLRLDLVAAGLRFLDRWQIAAPLWSYTELARDIGTEEERAATEAIVRDLRVPVYDTRVLFIRRCLDTERLLSVWREDSSGDIRLSFLRALYQVKPLMLALPTCWINGR